MKAIRFSETGGSDVLQYVDYDLPPPAKGEVRVKHTAIGVNFIDTYHRTGLYKLPMPSGLGSEAAGTIEALGEGVTNFKLGERVGYGSGTIGAYADANNVPADKLVKLPDGISDEVAAADSVERHDGAIPAAPDPPRRRPARPSSSMPPPAASARSACNGPSTWAPP